MLVKPIIIEITGLEGSGKSTLINMLKENNNFSEFFYIDDRYINEYKSKSKFQRFIDRIKNIFGNFRFNFYLLYILLKNGDMAFFLPIDFYMNYKYIKSVNDKYDIYICDEFLLNLVYVEYIKKYTHNYVSVKNIDTLLVLLANISIYPIHIKTDYETHIKRIKERKDSEYDRLSDEEKKDVLEKKGYLCEYIVKNYCAKQEIPFVEISGELSLQEKYESLKAEITYLLEYLKQNKTS